MLIKQASIAQCFQCSCFFRSWNLSEFYPFALPLDIV